MTTYSSFDSLKKAVGLSSGTSSDAFYNNLSAKSKEQQQIDYTKASLDTKQQEALTKLKFDVAFSGAKNLTRTTALVGDNGVVTVIDKATGKVIDTVGTPNSTADGNLPTGTTNNTLMFKASLYPTPGGIEDGVIFNVMPTITERRSASYSAVELIHHPGEILKYKNTSSRSWNLSTKLVSRNSEEASYNLILVNRLRSWVMPYYGQGTANSADSMYLGAPPPVLTFSAYGDMLIGPVKCVLENSDWTWPNDVDYIQTDTSITGQFSPTPFPVVVSVDISLKESWSPAEYSGFDLSQYKAGNMQESFKAIVAKTPAQIAELARTSRVKH